jgi:signal transduction histidine kinase
MTIDTIQVQPFIPPDSKLTILGFDKKNENIYVKAGRYIYLYNRNLVKLSTLECTDEDETVSMTNEAGLPFWYYYTKSQLLVSLNLETRKLDTILRLPNAGKWFVVNTANPKECIVATSNTVLNISITERIIRSKLNFPEHEFIPFCIKKDAQGDYWIGGKGNMFYYSPHTLSLIPITSRTGNSDSTFTGDFTDIILDKEDFYISSDNAGFLKYQHQYFPFTDYFSKEIVKHDVNTISIQKNELFAAIHGGVINQFTIGNSSKGASYDSIPSLYGDIILMEAIDDKYLWVEFENGLQLGLAQAKPFKLLQLGGFSIDKMANELYKKHIKFPKIDILPIIKKISKDLFYYSVDKYLYKVAGTPGKGYRFELIDSIETGTGITCITPGENEEILLGTSKMEIYLLQGKQLFRKFSPESTINIPVKSICTDKRTKLKYLVTINGLYILDGNFKLVEHVNRENRMMMSDLFYAGILDDNDILWLSGPIGIVAYDTKTKLNYDFPSNLFHNRDFTTRCVAQDSLGNIYFGGSTGVTAVHVKDFASKNGPTYLYFSEIRNEDSIIYQGMLPGTVASPKAFNYQQNAFQFFLHSIISHKVAAVRYKYKLEGLDKNWTFSNENRIIKYDNLPPGNFNLRVVELDGTGPDKEINYHFIILKPFWQSWWFIFLITTLLAFIAFIIIKFFIDKKFEKQRIKSAKEITLKNERERISRELHDSLGTGLTSIRLLSKRVIAKPANDEGTPKILQNVANISDELIDQMSEIIWLMNNMDDSINGLISYLRNYLSGYIQKADLPLRFNFESFIAKDSYINSIACRNLLLTIKEIFHNVVKHANATSFSIKFTESTTHVIAEMQDNGIGLPEIIPIRGNGINNMIKRIESINGEIEFTTRNGTSIIIQVPKK